MYRLLLELPGLTKTINHRHGNWRWAAKHNAYWRNLSKLNARMHPRPAKPLARCKIVFTRCSSMRTDFDNLVGSFKAICDGLIDAGIIVDDNDEVIVERIYKWEKAKAKEGKMRLELSEL